MIYDIFQNTFSEDNIYSTQKATKHNSVLKKSFNRDYHYKLQKPSLQKAFKSLLSCIHHLISTICPSCRYTIITAEATGNNSNLASGHNKNTNHNNIILYSMTCTVTSTSQHLHLHLHLQVLMVTHQLLVSTNDNHNYT